MTYRVQGILKLPDGAPAANCEIEFVSRKNFSPLVQGAKTNILTSATGAYDVTLEFGEYAVIVYTGGTYPAQAGTITLSSDTTPGLDLPSLLNRSDWVPATPEYMQQIEAWLVSAGEYAASAENSAQSAADSAASTAGAISAHEAKTGAHSIAGVSGLQQALEGKEAAGTAASAISTHKTESNAHAIEKISGLRGELDGFVKRASGTVYAEDYADFATAVATGKNVIYSSNFTVPTPVQTHPGQRITNAGTGVITFTGNGEIIPATGLLMEFPRFSGPAGKFAIRFANKADDVTISSPVAIGCNLINTGAAAESYALADWVGKSNIPERVTIINPVGMGSGGASSAETFMISGYTDGFKVIGGFCKNYYFGHYYWGGDSNFSANGGSRENVRKCDNIELIGFTTIDCVYAGMWGSMAKKVKRTNCSAIRTSLGGDVGIDDEGTDSAINVNCHAEGYQNGNFAGFFGFTNLQMIGCSSRQYAGKPHYRNYNDSNDSSKSGDVLISGGSYSTIDPQNGFATIDTGNGPARSFCIDGCASIENTLISLSTNGGCISVLDIEQLFTVPGSAAYVAISAGAASTKKIKVSGPRIRTDATPFAGSIGVRVTTANFNAADRVQVSDIDAPLLPIELKESGGNAGVSGRIWCYDNVVSAITRNNAGAKPLTLVRGDNNYTPAGSAITV